MLILTRKVEQQIVIGGKVTITILRVKGKSVQIGIEADPDVRVLRGELAAVLDERRDGEPSEKPETTEPIPPSAGSTRQQPGRGSRNRTSGSIRRDVTPDRDVAPRCGQHLTCSS